MAESALAAIRQEKNVPVDDVWIDEDWKREAAEAGRAQIGFATKKK